MVCECGRLISVKKTGQCKCCYDRDRYAKGFRSSGDAPFKGTTAYRDLLSPETRLSLAIWESTQEAKTTCLDRKTETLEETEDE